MFVTNARPGALERAGLDYATVSARNPRLVYASVSGYGVEGDERDRAAYDVGAFWSRAGIAAALTPDGADLPYQRGGMGDHMAGMAAAGAVAAALLARERTGEGQLVSTSLLRIGMYMMGWDISMSLRLGIPVDPDDGEGAAQPADQRVHRRRRPPVLDARTAGRSSLARRAAGRRSSRVGRRSALQLHRGALATLRRAGRRAVDVFATKPLAEWAEIFDREDVWWAPVQYAHETVDDPQAAAAGGFVEVPAADGGEPVAHGGDAGRLRRHAVVGPVDAPEFAQHTEEVLLELGYDWDRIIELKDAGAIP